MSIQSEIFLAVSRNIFYTNPTAVPAVSGERTIKKVPDSRFCRINREICSPVAIREEGFFVRFNRNGYLSVC